MKKEEFFAWCAAARLTTNSAIAKVFWVSSQTIRNWRKPDEEGKAPREDVPDWVPLACAAYEARVKASKKGVFERPEKMTVESFEDWRRRNGFDTYEDTGSAFGLSRQAVHNWFRRSRFPTWVPLACEGYELIARSKAAA